MLIQTKLLHATIFCTHRKIHIEDFASVLVFVMPLLASLSIVRGLWYTNIYHLNARASWTTTVVHSKDDEVVGVAHEVKSAENQPQFSQTTMMMEHYWLGKTKSKQAFRSTWNAFKKLP